MNIFMFYNTLKLLKLSKIKPLSISHVDTFSQIKCYGTSHAWMLFRDV
jgi:hypothetical protein